MIRKTCRQERSWVVLLEVGRGHESIGRPVSGYLKPAPLPSNRAPYFLYDQAWTWSNSARHVGRAGRKDSVDVKTCLGCHEHHSRPTGLTGACDLFCDQCRGIRATGAELDPDLQRAQPWYSMPYAPQASAAVVRNVRSVAMAVVVVLLVLGDGGIRSTHPAPPTPQERGVLFLHTLVDPFVEVLVAAAPLSPKFH